MSNLGHPAKTWNHLEQRVFEKRELMQGMEKREMGVAE
jgi:hypothetical protein